MVTDRERETRLRAAMAACDLDALLLWQSHELVLAFGLPPWLGASLCLYPREGTPVFFTPPGEPDDRKPERVILREWSPGTPANCVASSGLFALRRVGVATGAGRAALPGVGAETAPITEMDAARIVSQWPASVMDATEILNALMRLKTEEELKRIELARAVAQSGVDAFYAGATKGKTEAELAGEVEGAIHAVTGQKCAQARAWATVQSGPNTITAGQFSRSTGRPLQASDPVLLELATCVDGYWSDLTRMTWVGAIPTEQQTAWGAVRGAQNAAIETIRPGITGADVDFAARAWLRARGFDAYFTHATGHHVGFRYHDQGPGFTHGSTEILEPGMFLSVEPGVYGKELGFGMRIEDNIVVEPHGARVLGTPGWQA